MKSRNDPLGLAARVWKNFCFLEEASRKGHDVHLVSALTTSLLGLIVVPQQKNVVPATDLALLRDSGWPQWTIHLGQTDTKTLGDLFYHIRNAVAHGRLTFSSDARDLAGVSLTVADHKPGKDKPYWKAEIRLSDLRLFCALLSERLGIPIVGHFDSRVITLREPAMPAGVPGRLYLHSMPGRYEELSVIWHRIRELHVVAIVALAPLMK